MKRYKSTNSHDTLLPTMPLSEKHFYSIQNSLQDHAFIILDAKGCIVDASDSVATLTAYSADELLRQPLSIFLRSYLNTRGIAG